MVGGGSTPAPGEISLAHHGVLFLDELPEFNRRSLEVLRQPLEEGTVTISRALALDHLPGQLHAGGGDEPVPVRLPRRRQARVQVLLRCRSSATWAGSADPLLDRIDLHIEVPAVPFQELSASADGTSSAGMREQVNAGPRACSGSASGADSHRLNAA